MVAGAYSRNPCIGATTMNDSNDVTRRDFLRSTAMVTASSAVGHAQPVLNALMGQESASEATMPTVEVNMGSVFPAGGVYFRKSNPPAENESTGRKLRFRPRKVLYVEVALAAKVNHLSAG